MTAFSREKNNTQLCAQGLERDGHSGKMSFHREAGGPGVCALETLLLVRSDCTALGGSMGAQPGSLLAAPSPAAGTLAVAPHLGSLSAQAWEGADSCCPHQRLSASFTEGGLDLPAGLDGRVPHHLSPLVAVAFEAPLRRKGAF